MPIILVRKAEPLDPEVTFRATKRLEWLLSFLIIRFKFVHSVLGMLTKHATNNLETMGVSVTESGKFQLYYNPTFMAELTDEECTFVLYHEVGHIVLHHCTHRVLTPLREDQTGDDGHISDRTLWNFATDLAVNELVPVNESCKRPVWKQDDPNGQYKKGDLCGTFVSELKKKPEFSKIEDKQSAEWYYDFLRKNMKGQGSGKGKGDGKAGKDQSGQGQGKFDEHDGWREHEIADERVRAKVKEINQNDMWGSTPMTDRELIMAAQVKKINWRNKVRTWFGNLAWKSRSATRKRPNRRTGYVHPGVRKDFVDRWLVALDTSGSMDSELLGECTGVLNQLVEEIPLDFMQFDCEKTEDPHPYDRRRSKLEVKGRGGTDFQPVVDIADKRRYRGVMILTDGQAPAPTKPVHSKVIWVLRKGYNPPVEWGDRVHMEKRA